MRLLQKPHYVLPHATALELRPAKCKRTGSLQRPTSLCAALIVAHELLTYHSCALQLLMQHGAAVCKLVNAAQLLRACTIALLVAGQRL